MSETQSQWSTNHPMHLGVLMQTKSCWRDCQVQSKNLLERRPDDQQLGDSCRGGPMEHQLVLHHPLNPPWMDNQISQLGQRVSSSTTRQTNVHVHSKRLHEQVWQGRMLEGSTITLQIKVCTKDLVSTSAQSAVETGVPGMSLGQMFVPLTRHAHCLVCG